MPNAGQVALLLRGVAPWNEWRLAESRARPDLSGADLRGADLTGADLRRADLRGADLSGAILGGARLAGADLTGARLVDVLAVDADFGDARLGDANLTVANLSRASLTGADLTGADLTGVILVGTNLERSTLDRCRVYGASIWNVRLDGARQAGLRINQEGEADITVGDLELAQFVYLLLNTRKVRDVIDTVGNKVVLILGRFSPARKAVLDAVRDALAARDLVPIVFDFDVPGSRDVTETVRTLAHLSRFIIADLTDPRSVPQELATIVPLLPSVPVQPLIQKGHEPWAMFESLRRYPWVLPPHEYRSVKDLIASLDAHVLSPAQAAVRRHRPTSA